MPFNSGLSAVASRISKSLYRTFRKPCRPAKNPDSTSERPVRFKRHLASFQTSVCYQLAADVELFAQTERGHSFSRPLPTEGWLAHGPSAEQCSELEEVVISATEPDNPDHAADQAGSAKDPLPHPARLAEDKPEQDAALVTASSAQPAGEAKSTQDAVPLEHASTRVITASALSAAMPLPAPAIVLHKVESRQAVRPTGLAQQGLSRLALPASALAPDAHKSRFLASLAADPNSHVEPAVMSAATQPAPKASATASLFGAPLSARRAASDANAALSAASSVKSKTSTHTRPMIAANYTTRPLAPPLSTRIQPASQLLISARRPAASVVLPRTRPARSPLSSKYAFARLAAPPRTIKPHESSATVKLALPPLHPRPPQWRPAFSAPRHSATGAAAAALLSPGKPSGKTSGLQVAIQPVTPGSADSKQAEVGVTSQAVGAAQPLSREQELHKVAPPASAVDVAPSDVHDPGHSAQVIALATGSLSYAEVRTKRLEPEMAEQEAPSSELFGYTAEPAASSQPAAALPESLSGPVAAAQLPKPQALPSGGSEAAKPDSVEPLTAQLGVTQPAEAANSADAAEPTPTQGSSLQPSQHATQQAGHVQPIPAAAHSNPSNLVEDGKLSHDGAPIPAVPAGHASLLLTSHAAEKVIVSCIATLALRQTPACTVQWHCCALLSQFWLLQGKSKGMLRKEARLAQKSHKNQLRHEHRLLNRPPAARAVRAMLFPTSCHGHMSELLMSAICCICRWQSWIASKIQPDKTLPQRMRRRLHLWR